MSFDTLGLSARTLRAVRSAGFTTPTPIQSRAIPPILRRSDVIGIAQTGTGKTAAFALPTIEIVKQTTSTGPARALVLAPTRELAEQISGSFRTLCRGGHLRTTSIYGGVSERPQIASLRRGTDIVVATPGRLLDLMAQGHVDLTQLDVVVLDEADRMLDMGFLPAIRKILAETPSSRQTLMFSATLSREIEKLTTRFQNDPVRIQLGSPNNPALTVTQSLYSITKQQKGALLATLLRDPALRSVLVFSRTKHGADKIARNLSRSGIRAERIHSNRSQSQRANALESFRSGKSRVMVATDIAARGIDVDGITHVINFDFPPAAEDYVHRIGRTGRAERSGEALSFVTGDDEAAVRGVEKLTGRKLARLSVDGFEPVRIEIPAENRDREQGRSHPKPRSRRNGKSGRGRVSRRRRSS